MAPEAREDLEQLVDVGLASLRVAFLERLHHAVPEVVFEEHVGGSGESAPHRRDLREHGDTVGVFLDHAQDSSELALGALEPSEELLLRVVAWH